MNLTCFEAAVLAIVLAFGAAIILGGRSTKAGGYQPRPRGLKRPPAPPPPPPPGTRPPEAGPDTPGHSEANT